MTVTRQIRGREVLLDEQDLDLFEAYRWHVRTLRSGHSYVCSGAKIEGHSSTVLFHRVITNCPAGMVVDHINGNGLDNRRANLRVCHQACNVRNARKVRGTKNRYKGTKLTPCGRWQAHIWHGRTINLGSFETDVQAAAAYDAAARELFGEFARTNFGQPE